MKRLLLSLMVTLSTVALAQADEPGMQPGTQPGMQRDEQKTQKMQNKQGQRASGEVSPEVANALATLHRANELEIRAGKLAQKRGNTDAVKDFGQTLVQDHQQADAKLTELAKQKGIDLKQSPSKDSAENAEHKAMKQRIDQLETMKGARFDATFSQIMADAHQKAVNTAQRAVAQTDDQEVRDLLNQLIPTLEDHLETARELTERFRGAS
jgi:putative membrane protein